jgi:penicillin-binding protein 1A
MAGQGGTGRGGGRKPLVAERRYPSGAQAKAKAKAKSKTRAKPKPSQTAQRRKATRRRSSNIFVRLIGGLIRWVLRLFWVIFSRGALAGAVVLGLAIFYIYTTLPPFSQLLDGRARGSVTLTDRDGAVFAWRGEQFGGQITADTVSPYLKNAIIATEDFTNPSACRRAASPRPSKSTWRRGAGLCRATAGPR